MGPSLSKGASALLGRSSGGSTAAIVVPTTENVSVARPATLSDEAAKQERLDAMYQWILTHSPGVHPEHAMEYARAFYSAKMATIGRLGVNVSRDPVLLAALGVAVDDAAELLDALRVAGLVGPYDPAASQWSDASTATASATASASVTPYGNSSSFRGLAASGRVLPSVKEHGSGRRAALEVSVERDCCELCGASPAPPSATAPAPPSPLSFPQASAPPTPSSFPALPERTPMTCPVRPAAALRVVVQLLSVEGRVLCAGDAAGWLLFLPLPRAAPTVGPQVAFDGQGTGRTMVEVPGYATVEGRPGGPTAAFDGRGGEVCALLELADGRLCSGAEDGRVRIWDLAEPSFPATGAAAAAGGGGSTDRPHPAPAVTLAGHAGPVRALCETLSGCVVSGGRDRTIRCWDVATGACAAVLRCRGAGPVAALAPLLDPRHLCSAGADGALRLWAVGEGEGASAAAPRAGRCVAAVAPAHDGAIFAALQLYDGRVATAGEDLVVCLWAAGRGVCEGESRGEGQAGGGALRAAAALRGHRNWVKALAQLPDGRLCSAGNDRTVRVWRLHPRPSCPSSSPPSAGACERVLTGHTAPVTALAALLDGRVCAVSAEGARVWHAGTGACHALLAAAPTPGAAPVAEGAAWARGALDALEEAAARGGRAPLLLPLLR